VPSTTYVVAVDDDDATLQRLRHAAFSRNATDDDLRRLADLEARRATVVKATEAEQEQAQDVDVPHETVELEADLLDEPRRPLSRRRLALMVAVAVGGGAVVGAVIGVLSTSLAAPVAEVGGNWSGTSSLAVFDRDPTPSDDPEERLKLVDHLLATMPEGPTPGLPEVDVRWIGAPGGFTTYAVRSSASYATNVCVVVTSALDEVSSCVPASDFDEEGIRVMAYGLDLRWGPTGAELWANTSWGRRAISPPAASAQGCGALHVSPRP